MARSSWQRGYERRRALHNAVRKDPELKKVRREMFAAETARHKNVRRRWDYARIFRAMLPLARALLKWQKCDKRQQELDRKDRAANRAYRVAYRAACARARAAKPEKR